MTREQILKLWPHASAATIARNLDPAGVDRLHPGQPKPAQHPALDAKPKRKRSGSSSPRRRYFVTFIIYACHPMDWDNPFTKPLQDLLVNRGLIPSDNWQTLEGCVKSRKVATKTEERTELTIEMIL